jgi:hypothetical protein
MLLVSSELLRSNKTSKPQLKKKSTDIYLYILGHFN